MWHPNLAAREYNYLGSVTTFLTIRNTTMHCTQLVASPVKYLLSSQSKIRPKIARKDLVQKQKDKTQSDHWIAMSQIVN